MPLAPLYLGQVVERIVSSHRDEKQRTTLESDNFADAQVWQMFADDIQRTKQEVLHEREEYPAITPYFAGRALNLRLKGDLLLSTRKRLEEAEWMPYCSMTVEIYHQQAIVIKSIDDAVKNLYAQWLHDVGENPRSRLDRFLMRRSDNGSGLLECNIDPDIPRLCRESSYWISLKFTVPLNVQIIYDKRETLHYIQESVHAVALACNNIIEGRCLFQTIEMLNGCTEYAIKIARQRKNRRSVSEAVDLLTEL